MQANKLNTHFGIHFGVILDHVLMYPDITEHVYIHNNISFLQVMACVILFSGSYKPWLLSCFENVFS